MFIKCFKRNVFFGENVFFERNDTRNVFDYKHACKHFSKHSFEKIPIIKAIEKMVEQKNRKEENNILSFMKEEYIDHKVC